MEKTSTQPTQPPQKNTNQKKSPQNKQKPPQQQKPTTKPQKNPSKKPQTTNQLDGRQETVQANSC